ncbi:G2/mitotic-specific cyclin S13-7-like [Impatiens glandulifera]|uniref:G2/mitotic-specific cyclin S13-7-like n=1 Tax=Impatiens glandulifera TaxID=253017 RepID=UPI001FB11DC5|nr:G2/mitotic-specific cyclin S13-7-like [Impatiens glandulifera]
MASRVVVQQQTRGGEAAPVPVKTKNMAADAKNRRALGDIGNVATVRGIDPKKITRPVTRSFGAQLLANAQAAQVAAAGNKKVTAVADGRVAAKPAPAAKQAPGLKPKALPVPPNPAQKKAIAKPKVQAVVEIIPDNVEEKAKKVKPPVPAKKEGSSSRRKTKTVQTLTSLLSARSKTACGMNDKKKEIIDVDAGDIQNELAVVEYIEDIYKFYKLVENESRAHDYIDSQPEINEKMRAILIDWLIEVHHKFELTMETLYLTINIVDRYLASKLTQRKELQLVGVGAMLMASKYEEIWAPEVNDLVCISDRAYSHQQILIMEKRILEQLEWNLTVPTPFMFLVRFIKASSSSSSGPVPDKDMENMSYFLAEMGMVNYTGVIHCPSMIAASAVFVARCTLGKKPYWNETLKLHTGYSSELQLMDCAKLLVKFHSMAAENKLKSCFKKYSSTNKGVVALIPPAKFLLG